MELHTWSEDGGLYKIEVLRCPFFFQTKGHRYQDTIYNDDWLRSTEAVSHIWAALDRITDSDPC